MMETTLTGNDMQFSLDSGDSLSFSISSPEYIGTDIYTGQTVVNPDFNGITLRTAHKLLTDDISVTPIQVESVSNLEGGRTVYIGGII